MKLKITPMAPAIDDNQFTITAFENCRKRFHIPNPSRFWKG